MQKLVVFSGAGISAESGLKTFRDSDGLWENYNIEDVATPQAWVKNKKLVLDFYNERRTQVMHANPNDAHLGIATLQEKYDVTVITQNIDDLHERAGSKKVMHLHGEIVKSRSTIDPTLIYDVNDGRISLGDMCQKGSQLRPHIVWFGEMVPALSQAEHLVSGADIFIVVGTSLLVYPAAGLVHHAMQASQKYYIDPAAAPLRDYKILKDKATKGVKELVNLLMQTRNE